MSRKGLARLLDSGCSEGAVPAPSSTVPCKEALCGGVCLPRACCCWWREAPASSGEFRKSIELV